MGAPPELPGDSGEKDFHQIINVIPSDDSDNDENDLYSGYQLLSINDQGDETQELDNSLVEDFHSTINAETNFPAIETVDAEVERQVWSEPRPRELQIELDSSRTQQIISVMANVTLPNISIPEWASVVSEERWKEELLERIRRRNELNVNNDTDKNQQ